MGREMQGQKKNKHKKINPMTQIQAMEIHMKGTLKLSLEIINSDLPANTRMEVIVNSAAQAVAESFYAFSKFKGILGVSDKEVVELFEEVFKITINTLRSGALPPVLKVEF